MPNVNKGDAALNNGDAALAPLRVLFVATSGGEGGIERYSMRLAALLRARGVAVIYACRPDGFLASQCAALGIPTVAWQVRNSGDIASALALARLVRRNAIDIVHVHSRRDYVPAVLAARLARRARLLLHAHLVRALGDPPRLAGRFFRWGADRVIAVSEAVRQRLLQEHGFSLSFVPLLPNGVDVTAYEKGDGAALRKTWGIPPDALVIGMIGRLNAKGQDLLLSAGPDLIRSNPQVWFVVAGPVGAADDRERLLRQAQALGIADRLILPGMIEDVPSAMAAFDILAHLPSDESFGLALAEAMAAGKPTVATDIGGCREVVLDRQTGFLVPFGDAAALHAALQQLLDPVTGPSLRTRMGVAGRDRIITDFSLDRQVERLYTLYQQVRTEASAQKQAPQTSGALNHRRGAPMLAAVMLAAFALAVIAHHHVINHHVARHHPPIRLRLESRPDYNVPRSRGRAQGTEI
jgi:glycosyltransferase involved in cell wall biosynthesis